VIVISASTRLFFNQVPLEATETLTLFCDLYYRYVLLQAHHRSRRQRHNIVVVMIVTTRTPTLLGNKAGGK